MGMRDTTSARRLALAMLCGEDHSAKDSAVAWSDLIQFAIHEGLCGILARRLRELGHAVPDSFHEQLCAAASQVAAANLHALHVTEQLVAEFHRAGVPVMLLKGIALLRTIYDNPGLRPISDVDLLIRPSDCDAAASVLTNFGAKVGRPLLNEGFFPQFHYEQEWIIPGARPVRIDLHARPLRPLRVSRTMPDEGIWEDARTIKVGDASAMVPNSEMMLIHLAAHASFHGGERILWLYDINQWVADSESELDWNILVQRCREWQLSCAVYKALDRCSQVLATTMPERAMRELKSEAGRWRDRWVLRQAPCDAESPLGHILCNFVCTPGIGFRLAYLKALLAPDHAHLAETYRFRHVGWKGIAHLHRWIRAGLRASRLGVSMLRTH